VTMAPLMDRLNVVVGDFGFSASIVIAIAIVLCSTAAPPAPSLIMKDRLPQACAAPPRDAFLA
jgi:hypothetical protein